MQIVRYSKEKSSEWDDFVKASRNGTFLFLRGYMDYHSDRFEDHSLMYYNDKGKLLAVLPSNERTTDGKKALFSHQGLTYGGFVLSLSAKSADVLEIFSVTKDYLKAHEFSEFHYKQIPIPYHKHPSQEDEYALWTNGTELECCKLGTAVSLKTAPKEFLRMVRATKKTDRNRLLRMGYTIEIDAELEDFWPVLTGNLMKSFGVLPVHTLDEIQLLKERFPENIVCCVIRNTEGVVEAGTVLYLMDNVVHTQYISASETGKNTNALDCLLLSLLLHYREQEKYSFFDFGTSMDDDNVHLKPGLIAQKEGFGGRGIVYKQFILRL